MPMRGWMTDGNWRTGSLRLNWQLLQAGFPITAIQVHKRARYLGAPDEDLSRHTSVGAQAEHAVQGLDLRTLVAGAGECSLNLAVGGK